MPSVSTAGFQLPLFGGHFRCSQVAFRDYFSTGKEANGFIGKTGSFVLI